MKCRKGSAKMKKWKWNAEKEVLIWKSEMQKREILKCRKGSSKMKKWKWNAEKVKYRQIYIIPQGHLPCRKKHSHTSRSPCEKEKLRWKSESEMQKREILKYRKGSAKMKKVKCEKEKLRWKSESEMQKREILKYKKGSNEKKKWKWNAEEEV